MIDGYEGYAAQGDGKYEKEEVLDKAVSLLCDKLDYMHRYLQQTATRGSLDSHNLVVAHRGDFLPFKFHDLTDFHGGDFSFSLRIRPEQLGGKTRRILHKAGSWKLVIDSENRLRLNVRGVGERRVVIRDDEALQIGREYEVRVTIYGFKNDNSLIRLFRDGALVGNSLTAEQQIVAVASNDHPIELSSLDNETISPFIGSMRDLRFYSLDLTQVP